MQWELRIVPTLSHYSSPTMCLHTEIKKLCCVANQKLTVGRGFKFLLITSQHVFSLFVGGKRNELRKYHRNPVGLSPNPAQAPGLPVIYLEALTEHACGLL